MTPIVHSNSLRRVVARGSAESDQAATTAARGQPAGQVRRYRTVGQARSGAATALADAVSIRLVLFFLPLLVLLLRLLLLLLLLVLLRVLLLHTYSTQGIL
jgi:hypothetical protein